MEKTVHIPFCTTDILAIDVKPIKVSIIYSIGRLSLSFMSFIFLPVSSLLDTHHCQSITKSGKSGFFIELQQHQQDTRQHKLLSITELQIFNWYLAG